ncbi:MAG: glycosyltransferase [Chitinispirillales bacterium]|jgi:glycosyltransferase involved in cell wall biosynthesis|nr:glycosyltransferase [Chitinispirillales bacterium]
MNILMMTNTYLPFLGGVERSVQTFSEEYTKAGHHVIIIAPADDNAVSDEPNVIRVPAIQRFNGTDFSVQLPLPGVLTSALKDFTPHIIHSHHPYLLGDSALRLAAHYEIPVVFTFHTFYEMYTHYIPGDSAAMKRFVSALAVGYANLCDCVIAPSRYVAAEIKSRGVNAPLEVIPTGISLEKFKNGDGTGLRGRYGIGADNFVVGFISRLAPEKNIGFLISAVKKFLLNEPHAHFLLVGTGPSKEYLLQQFEDPVLESRFHYPGTLCGQELVDAYHCLDAFVFASHSETQGLVITEALASGVPVVSLDEGVVMEVVRDGYNGYLADDEDGFVRALKRAAGASVRERSRLRRHAAESAAGFDREVCAHKALRVYEKLLIKNFVYRSNDGSAWSRTGRMLKAEMNLIVNMTRAFRKTFG